MTSRIKYAIPALAGVLALMAFFVLPVAAEQIHFASIGGSGPGSDTHEMDDPLTYMELVDGFEGAVQLSFESDATNDVEDKINVSLADAAAVAEQNGLVHAVRAQMEPIKNDQDKVYLVWAIQGSDSSRVSSEEGHIPVIFIVDAGNAENFAMISMTPGLLGMPGVPSVQGEEIFEGHIENLLEPTGDAERDAFQAKVATLLEQLRDAGQAEDYDTVRQIEQQLNSLYHESVHLSRP